MESETPPVADKFSQPFYTYDQNGQISGGFALSDPKYQAGTAEASLWLDSPEARNRPNVLQATKRMRALFEKQNTQYATGVFRDLLGMEKDANLIAPFSNQDEARKSLALADVETDHNAEHVFTVLSPTLRQLSQSKQDEGDFEYRVHTLSDDVLIGLAEGAGIDRSLVTQLKTSKRNPYRDYGIDLMTKLRGQIVKADNEYQLGEKVARDLQGELFLEQNPEWKARKMLAYQYYTAVEGPNQINAFSHAIGTLFGAFADTGANLAIGVGEAVAGTDEQSLSRDYLTDPKLRQKALSVVSAAERTAKVHYDRIKEMSPEEMYAASLEFAQQPENQKLLFDLEQLKKDGAFQDASRFSRLYSVFDGSIRGTQDFYRMFVGSTDPNSVMFQVQMASEDDIPANPLGRAISRWAQGTDRFRRMNTQELLKVSDRLESNYYAANENADMGGFARLYKAVGFEEAAVEADMMTNLSVSEPASMAIDIPTLVGGVVGIGMKGAKGAAMVAFVDSKLAGAAAKVGGEILTAVGEAGVADAKLTTAVANIRSKLKTMGVEVTDNEAIALAMSQSAASGEVRVALRMAEADVNTVKQTVGQTLTKNKAVRESTKTFLADAKAASTAAAKTTAAEGTMRGFVAAKGAGEAASFVGRWTERTGDLLLGTSPDRLSLTGRKGVKLMRTGLLSGAAGGVMTATSIAEGGWSDLPNLGAEFVKNTGTAAAFGFGSKYLGYAIKRQGRLLSSVANEIATGERKGASIFLQSADRLDLRVAALKKAGASKDEILDAVTDAKALRIAHSMGLEKPLAEMAIVTYQGAAGAATGAVLAYLNNEQAASAGAGFGFGGAMIAGAAARLGAMMPKGVQANRDMTVMANSLYVLNKRSAKERALFYEAFEREVGVNPDGSFKNREKGLRMLESLTLLDGGLMGAFEIIREGELVGKTIGMQHTGINVDAVKTLAGQMYPNDAAMAANYAESLIQRANFQNNQAAKVAALNGQVSKNADAIAFAEKNIGKKREALALAEQSNNAKRTSELKSEISQAETNIEVLKRENEKFTTEQTLERSRMVDREAVAREADARGLKGQERADFIETEALRRASELDPIRPGELRVGQVGTSIRQIADGVFINDAQGGKVYINADRTTALTMVHEAFEGILRDDAMKAAMPELVDFLYASPGSGKRVLSEGNRQRFFDLYASDLDPKLAKSYLEQLKNAEKLYADTGDFSALLPYVQEATAWWLSVIHDSRPVGYAPGVSTPRGLEAPRPRIFDRLFQGEDKGRSAPRRMYDLLMGERSFTELALDAGTANADRAGAGAAAEWMAFIDPDMGWLGQRTRSFIRGRLESNGFSMLEGSDGTVRGFFREDGVIQRGFILDDMYEAVARNLGGVSGVRRANADPLSDPRAPESVKVEWAEQNGLGHLVNRPEDGGAPTIKTPEEIGQTSQQINETIRETISTVDPSQTGLETRIEGNNTVVTGKPTEADINAIRNNQNLPPNIRDNLVAVMESAAAGNTNYVLRGRYVNVKTRQKGVGTEERLLVPRDTGGAVSDEKEFLPLGLIFGMSDRVPGGQKLPSPVPTVRVVGFDIKAAKGNLLNIRNKGMFDLEGNVVVPSDGKALTPDRFRELFPTDSHYWNAVNAYTSHLMAAGYIDPKNNRPVMPANMEPSAVVMARLAGDPTNIKLGEAMRDAVRFGLGIDSRKDLVLLHPAPYKKVLRDINQTISDFRLDGLGKLTTTGEQFPINASVIAWSQANMAPSTWTKLPEQTLASIKDGGNGWVGTSAVAHPNTNYVIVQDNRPVQDGKPEVRFRIYDEKGALVENSAKNMREARDAVRNKLATDEANSQIADVVAQAVAEGNNAEVGVLQAAASKAGYTIGPVFHGTPTGGFNVFDINKQGSGAGVSRGGFSFTTNEAAAKAYSTSAGTSSYSQLISAANQVFKSADPKKYVFDMPANEIELRSENIDGGMGEAVEAIRDYADKYEKAGMKEQADQLRAVASMALSNPTPEVKRVFIRIGENPLVVKTTKANMAKDIWGVRAEKGRNVIVELEDGERIFYVNDPSDIKSAEPFVFDDNGVEVPLERRFGRGSDVRGDLSGLTDRTRKGVAFSEESSYYAARAKRIAAAARRIIKEQKIEFTRSQNEGVEIQRKWEEEAARRAAGERKAEAAAAVAAYDDAARKRAIENAAGKQFKLPSEQLSLAERYYLGEGVKLTKALADIDKTAPGLVNLQKMLQTPMSELGVEVRTVGMVEAGLPIYRKAFMFNKRSLSKAPLDVAAARGAIPGVADAMTLGRAKAEFQSGQEYMLSNAMGQIIVSNLRRESGQPPVRYFSVYSSGMKTKIAESQDFRVALEAMLSEAYRMNSQEIMSQTRISTKAVIGIAKQVEEKAKKGEGLAPAVIQRYR